MLFICRRLQKRSSVFLHHFSEAEPASRTCLAIGPDDSEKIDAITGQLQLL